MLGLGVGPLGSPTGLVDSTPPGWVCDAAGDCYDPNEGTIAGPGGYGPIGSTIGCAPGSVVLNAAGICGPAGGAPSSTPFGLSTAAIIGIAALVAVVGFVSRR